MNYLTVKNACVEKIIKKSKFITYVFNIHSQEEATSILKDLRKKYYDCTHICYGYIADIEGKDIRFSDDGEPGGTAGQPILEVIKMNNLRYTLVAIVRYFGGIKLGASGLTRAYSDCASHGIHACEIENFILCNTYKITLDFNLYQKLLNILQYNQVKIQSTNFTNIVSMVLAIPTENNFSDYLINWSCGKIQPVLLNQSYQKFN